MISHSVSSVAGHLWCAFDSTYLTQSFAQTTLHGKRVLVGGCWTPDEDNGSCLDMEADNIDLKGIEKAGSMLTFLTWDPEAKKKHPLTVCTLPTPHGFGGGQGTYKSNWTMLEIVGRVLEADANSASCIRGIVFDAHGSHAFVRRVMMGDFTDVNRVFLRLIPFFSKLRYEPLPSHPLPRLPLQLAKRGDENIFCMVGPCILVGMGSTKG